jgi:hypothetical protein
MAREELRRAFHEALDLWFDRWEKIMEEKRPGLSLAEMTEVLREHRQELTAMIMQKWLESKYREWLAQETASCRKCGRVLRRWGMSRRRVETLIGGFELKRPYFYCRECKEGFHPLDEALRLAPGEKQYDMEAAGIRVAAEMSYEAAAELFEELTKTRLSDETLHEGVGQVGEGLGVLDVAPTADEMRAKVAEVARGKARRPVLVLAIDGAHMPTRPDSARGPGEGVKRARARRPEWKGQWREAKGFRFYLADGDRIVHLLAWHQIGSDEELAAALRQVKEAGLFDESSVRLCVVADGARWIWKVVHELFPTAREILDYYHCSEHLHGVAQAQWGDGVPGLEWVEGTVARLFCGEVDEVIESLRALKPRTADAEKVIARCAAYLEANRHRVDYGSYERGRYPIGSGGIESAHRFICQARLKLPGAWWYVGNANAMLALRCAKYNGTFERVFEKYAQREQGRPRPGPANRS